MATRRQQAAPIAPHNRYNPGARRSPSEGAQLQQREGDRPTEPRNTPIEHLSLSEGERATDARRADSLMKGGHSSIDSSKACGVCSRMEG
eukprot:scaffold18144_cov130-Isochrysis_galbana.AAC.5